MSFVRCRVHALAVVVGAWGCSHDWDGYDPRSSSSSAVTSTGSVGSGGASTATSTGPGGGTSSASSGVAAGGSAGAGAGGGGGTGGDSRRCTNTIFADDFSGDLSAWQAMNGTWEIDGGALVQQDETVPETQIFVPSFGELTDYRVQVTTTMVDGATENTTELVARIDPQNPGNRYWCGFQVSAGRIIIRVDANYQKVIDTNNTVVDLTQTPGYSPTAPHVMNFEVIGNALHCWVEGVVGADVTGLDNTYESGTFGLKTYLQHASFDDVVVCD